ncbi:hypothetical protein CLV63_108118 [Murinocardiopsis flavida]|uniref:DUF6879 domain-containing protein n=1 Tax=Murinocardiopsis flavida TaxID=645275 RepID=A0A2P8DJN6_9ACTN|nr:DUF6879 family protein [Murinocardiopsis flavida]PSK97399.1 hypothetical protein CLV63_108118 [Murinocardiopsis flavida]
MSTVPAAEFAAQFLSWFQVSAFRLDTLGFYLADNEREPYRRFLAGQEQDLSWRHPWQRTVRQIGKRDRTIGRVHIVPDPLTDDLRFELTCAYPANVAAGEDAQILARSEADGIGLPDGEDFWLFDDRRSAVPNYGPGGEFTEVEFADADRVDQHVEWRCAAQAAAVPLHDYLEFAGLAPAE